MMELASWAILVGILAIPELIFVVHMISDHWVSLHANANNKLTANNKQRRDVKTKFFKWHLMETEIKLLLIIIIVLSPPPQGLYSAYGLTELIGYLVRLTVNAFGLLFVFAQCNRWRSENQMLLSKILIDPNHSQHHHHHHHNHQHPHIHFQQHPQYATHNTGSGYGGGGTLSKKTTFDNFAFNALECPSLPATFGAAPPSKNEFNASAFGLHVEPPATAAGLGFNSHFGHSKCRVIKSALVFVFK